jgi:hypothetical protein
MNMNDDYKSYEVGYKKPPVEKRFLPGVSGNPHGRPKSARNYDLLLGEILNENASSPKKRHPKENWRVHLVTTLVDRAIAGDMAALKRVMRMMRELDVLHEPQQAPKPSVPSPHNYVDFAKAIAEAVGE